MARWQAWMVGAIVLLALAPGVAGDGVDFTKPVAVAAMRTDTHAVVTWVQGTETPDFYRVYGITSEAMTPLLETNDTSAEAPLGFSRYAVSAVSGDEESEPVLALLIPNTISAGCITIYPGIPPGISIGSNCGHMVGIGEQVGIGVHMD